MSKVGRNQPCLCGSGAKAKRCCEARRGPSEADLAKAFLVEQRRATAPALRSALRKVDDLIELYTEVGRLPNVDLSCHLRLPAFLPPELERLQSAIATRDGEEFEQALGPALARVDSPLVRAELGRAVLALRGAGRITNDVAAAAFLDLDSESDCLIREALLASLAVKCGASRTPAGLLLAG
ncbi:MAG TPA: SEC-C metal-binding domain-containing protein [Acidimicrobiales bacterium]|nr:SEC-C metal-binding domain-containing protein [Acidimicrobiales bacterium]